jgi:hypothetical protein
MCLRNLRILPELPLLRIANWQERLQEYPQHSSPAENDSLLLLKIDECDCKYQDRAPANQKLFDVSIEHGTPPLERLPIRRPCYG